MGRGGKGSCKSNFKRRVRSKDKDSDDSDEDYVISDAENDESDGNFEDYCSSLDENGSEDSFVEEDDEEKRMVRKVKGTKPKRSSSRKIGSKTSRKRKRVVTFDDDEDEEDGDEDYEEEDDDDDDQEFSPDDDDDDSLDDEEEELTMSKRKINTKVGRKRIQSRDRRKRRKSSSAKKPSKQKKGLKRRRLRKKQRRNDDDDDDDLDFIESGLVVRNKNKTNSSHRKRRYVVESESDFVSSASSDCEYTISEEEKEQIKEANRLCGNLRTSLRSSSSFSNKTQEEVDDLVPRRKALRRKGKEKVVEEAKTEVVTQVCGICLSEEDKRRLRGTLNCCIHYFCFTCIMEWSKVESRCPLCKQRFKTISKPARTGVAVGLRDVVIQVPKRDQVYQPTEEEMRSYLDPYESVICSECHQGGDDGLMLLCDLCDSSAHTYCVGLGREVPDGNWYCDGCKPVALGSSSSHVPNPLPDQRTTVNNNRSSSPIASLGDGLGLEDSFVSSPRTTIPQGIRNRLSPRFPSRDVQATNPVTGAGASTLSGRRMIHRHIHNLLSMNRMSAMVGRTDEAVSTTDSFNHFSNSPVNRSRDVAFQPAREGMLHNSNTMVERRMPDYPSSSMLSEDNYSSRLGHLRREPVVQGSSTRTTDRPVDLTLWPELAWIGRNEQVHHNGRLVTGSDGGGSMEQVQSMVKIHLKNLSRDIDLGEKTFKEIATSSTDTILAACGLEHSRSEDHVVPPPVTCCHVNNNMGMIGQTSVMKGCCSDCFDSFVKDVVKRIMDTRLPQWLSLGL